MKQDPALRPAGRGTLRVQYPCSLGKVQGVTDELNKLLILTTWSGGLRDRGDRPAPAVLLGDPASLPPSLPAARGAAARGRGRPVPRALPAPPLVFRLREMITTLHRYSNSEEETHFYSWNGNDGALGRGDSEEAPSYITPSNEVPGWGDSERFSSCARSGVWGKILQLFFSFAFFLESQ